LRAICLCAENYWFWVLCGRKDTEASFVLSFEEWKMTFQTANPGFVAWLIENEEAVRAGGATFAGERVTLNSEVVRYFIVGSMIFRQCGGPPITISLAAATR